VVIDFEERLLALAWSYPGLDILGHVPENAIYLTCLVSKSAQQVWSAVLRLPANDILE
jgi:hypothetical protein